MNGSSRWTWTSSTPGITWWPVASITFVDLSPSRLTPKAVIFSPIIPISPVNVPAGVTTLPPLTIRSNVTDLLLRSGAETPPVEAFPLGEPLLLGEAFLFGDAVLFFFFVDLLGTDRFLLGNGRQRSIEHVQSEVRILSRDAHRRLDAQHIAIDPTLSNENAHLSRRLEHRQRFLFCWLFRLSITHELDAKHQAHTPYISDQLLMLRQFLEAVLEPLADHS